MKPKLVEILGEGQPTLVNMKFIKKISNGASMYDCAVGDKVAVHFDSGDKVVSGSVVATKNGKGIVFSPAVPHTPATPAPMPVPPPAPATPAPMPVPPPAPATPAPAPAPVPPTTLANNPREIDLSRAVKVAEYIITRLSQQREVLGDNFASTVNTLLIQCLRNVSIDLSLPPPLEQEAGNDLPF